MGGLEIDENYVVLGSVSEAIGGLNATGEVARGVHGNYRSGGNSLMDYVGFRPCGKRSSCQVRVVQQHGGQLQLHPHQRALSRLRVAQLNLAQGSVTGYKDVINVGERTLMSAVTRQPRVYRH